ncbi:MAG: hypothetical protein RLZZ316_2730, partial [Bacteroidota bacterium]
MMPEHCLFSPVPLKPPYVPMTVKYEDGSA